MAKEVEPTTPEDARPDPDSVNQEQADFDEANEDFDPEKLREFTREWARKKGIKFIG